jgi:hypothetical protein
MSRIAGSYCTVDPRTEATLFRHGNFDYVTNSTIWDPTTSGRTLPNSLYLKERPAFFGTHTWPWVDPQGSTDALRVRTLPAKARFDAGQP